MSPYFLSVDSLVEHAMWEVCLLCVRRRYRSLKPFTQTSEANLPAVAGILKSVGECGATSSVYRAEFKVYICAHCIEFGGVIVRLCTRFPTLLVFQLGKAGYRTVPSPLLGDFGCILVEWCHVLSVNNRVFWWNAVPTVKTFLMRQFCKTQPKSGVEEEARIKAELERKKRANAQITLMDPKTSQNVGIALAKIRLSNEKVWQRRCGV